MNNSLDNILSHLKGVKAISGGFQALCPAHEDTKPSLSINVSVDRRVLMKCHAGCKTVDIVKSLGLEMKNLFPNNTHNKPKSKILEI